MALALEWTGQGPFNQQSFDQWYVGDRAAGKVRSFEGFTFATIYGAGHMVRNHLNLNKGCFLRVAVLQAPCDKPEEALELVRRWIAEESL